MTEIHQQIIVVYWGIAIWTFMVDNVVITAVKVSKCYIFT